jgi:hypothetical protein
MYYNGILFLHEHICSTKGVLFSPTNVIEIANKKRFFLAATNYFLNW